VALLDKGMKPKMARLTLARKIAAIALTIWKKVQCHSLVAFPNFLPPPNSPRLDFYKAALS
jgi:hypothetical protein